VNKGIRLIIFGAIAECGWVFGLKYAHAPLAIALAIACLVFSFFAMILATRYIDASVTYVIYVGLGTAFVVIAESVMLVRAGLGVSPLRVLFVATLIAGVIGIKSGKGKAHA